jgi:hypothetical protein
MASALLGIASGYLGTIGATAVIINSDKNDLPEFLADPQVEQGALVVSIGESLANAFIPILPPRSKGLVLLGRVLMGAGSAALFASTRKADVAKAAGVGGAAAGLTAMASTPTRAVLNRFFADPLVAAAETFLAICLARGATKR